MFGFISVVHLCSFSSECRFNKAVGLVAWEENFAGVVHSERREIHQVEMLVGEREMDFADAEKGFEALGLFEERKVLEVNFEAPCSVRITPSASEPSENSDIVTLPG